MRSFFLCFSLLTYIDYPSSNALVTITILTLLLWIIFEGVEEF